VDIGAKLSSATPPASCFLPFSPAVTFYTLRTAPPTGFPINSLSSLAFLRENTGGGASINLRHPKKPNPTPVTQEWGKNNASSSTRRFAVQSPCTISARNQVRRSVWSIQTSIRLAVAMSLYFSQVS
jgi:hypothetical protein